MPRKLDVVTHNCNPRAPEWDAQWGPQLSSQLASRTPWQRKESHSLRTEAIQEGSLPIFFLIPSLVISQTSVLVNSQVLSQAALNTLSFSPGGLGKRYSRKQQPPKHPGCRLARIRGRKRCQVTWSVGYQGKPGLSQLS